MVATAALRVLSMKFKFILPKLLAIVADPAFLMTSNGTQQAAGKTLVSDVFLGIFPPKPMALARSRLAPCD